MYNDAINAPDIASAHLQVIRRVLNQGHKLTTEDDEETIELPYPLMVNIQKPNDGFRFISDIGYSKDYLDTYAYQMVHDGTNKEGFAYTYGQRLLEFDQLETAIDKLILHPESRRAIIHTWRLPEDMTNRYPPCLQTVQFTIRSNQLNAVATFRSNDMLKAWGCNAYGLGKLMEYVTNSINDDGFDESTDVKCGELITISNCAHIYYINGQDVIEKIAKLCPINMVKIYGEHKS
jgi:thymidylate synthase (methanogen type)